MVLVLGAVAWAAAVRFAFNDWDGLANLHPDERHLARVVAAVEIPPAWSDYLDADVSPLNPRERGVDLFVYGDLPVTLARLAAESLADLCGQSMSVPAPLGRAACVDATGSPVSWTDIDGITRLGRALSSLFALLSVVLTGLIAWRLAGAAAGVIATWLAAGCVLSIQSSNFFTVDAAATAFVLASFVCVLYCRRLPRDWPAMLLAGFALGAAAACKITLLTFAVVPAAAVIAVAMAEPAARSVRATIGIAAMSVGLYVAVRVLSPSAFDGWVGLDQRWLEDLRVARALVSGSVDYPPGVQWTGRVPWLFPLHTLVTWGMGLPLAAVALGGWLAWGVAAVRRMPAMGPRGFHDPAARGLALAWLWVAVFFAWQGGQWVSTLRYLLPMVFFLVVFAAWALSRWWRQGRVSAWARRGAVLGVIGLSLAWTFAFLAVYAPPHPRLAASDWISARFDPGAVIGYEYWDDPLPVGGDSGDSFERVALDLYAEDTAAKRQRLVDQLASIDYLVLSSNRLVASIPRQPMRYPMTGRYYAALTSGALGFEPVADFAAWPRLGPFVFPDQEWPLPPALRAGDVVVPLPPAEEAFSVYDHPRVIVYRKRADFSASLVSQVLSAVDVESAYHGFRPRAETAAPDGLLFTPAQWRARETRAAPAGDGGDGGDGGMPRHVLAWLAASLILGWLAMPVVARLAPGLADGGASLARVFAIVAVSLGVWWAANTGWGANTARGAYAAVALLALVSVLSWRRARVPIARRTWLIPEAVFVVAFAVALVVRAGTPELWHPVFGGEKPMDFAYFNAVLQSPALPPHDPWFALGVLNYYYFGFVMVSVLTKLTAVPPAVAYNLAMALWFALLCQVAFGIGFHLSARLASRRSGYRPLAGGVLAALLTGCAGNLVHAVMQLRGECRVLSVDPCVFWNASRAVAAAPGEPAPITEFPFFTMLYGDLHAHFLSLPVLLLTVGLALAWTGLRTGLSNPVVDGARAAVVGALIAVLYMTNAWDAPVALALVVMLVASAVARDPGTPRRKTFVALAIVALAIGVAAMVATPYVAHFATDYGRLAWWRGSRTTLPGFLAMLAPFLFPLAAAWLLGRRRVPASASGLGDVARYFVAGAVVVPASALVLLSAPTALIVLPLLLVTWQSWRRGDFDAPLACLVGTGLGLVLAVEFVHVQGDVGRMNTVFKFTYHAWVLLGISAAVLVPRLWYLAGRRRAAVRLPVRASVLLLLAGALSYPLFAVPAKWAGRPVLDAGWQLDGTAYLRRPHAREAGRIQLPDGDLAAIRWLRANAGPVDVVAEGASTAAYTWGGRIAVHTGRPTLLGWLGHQRQQKSILPRPVVDRRAADVERLYGSGDAQTVRRILARYHVAYIVVGGWERAHYDANALALFDRLVARGELVERLRQDAVVIYEVAARAPLEASLLQPVFLARNRVAMPSGR